MSAFNLFRAAEFVPSHSLPAVADIKQLQQFIDSSRRLYVVTGAGISTESGLPDYRSEGVGLYARSKSRPLQYSDFLRSQEARNRYWARNYAGWANFQKVKPNKTHQLIREWERVGKLYWLVTQNVDALHRKAGSTRFTELHGCMHEVECLGCEALFDREAIQTKIRVENEENSFDVDSISVSPDGDVFIPDDQTSHFRAPLCDQCGGVLKPRVVFFGDNVRREVVEETQRKLSQSDALLSIGSSLQTFSSYRILLQAQKEGKPIFIINIGATRADHLAKYKINSLASLVLSSVAVSSVT